jgi:hypothetical protein
MKVGILTFQWFHNYGAILQAYALQKSIERLGHSAKLINFCTDQSMQANQPFYWNGGTRRAIKSLLNLAHYNELRARYERCEAFRNQYLNLTERYSTESMLRSAKLGFDAVLCGSDQVWNTNTVNSSIWVLDFVKDARKISYAPSFGGNSVQPDSVHIFQDNLPKFDSLSCRESDGVRIVKELTGLDAAHVLDPTLIVDTSVWEGLCCDKVFREPYILVYSIEESIPFFNLIKAAKKKLKLPVVLISKGSTINRYPNVDKIVRDAGPKQFLGLFRDASFVCTNSFHGTAFSIIFRKQFLSVKHSTQNARMSSLLALTGLESRQQITGLEPLEWAEERFETDYDIALDRLKPVVEKSIYFLKDSLS